MNRTPVQSHNLKAVGYENGTLQIEFVTGRVYEYFDVSPLVHGQLMNAESVGKFFTEHIRDRYEHREIAVPQSPDFAALVDGIADWQDEDRRGVYFDHAARLHGLGFTDLSLIRAVLTTLYQTAAGNEAARKAVLTTEPAETIHERINYRAGQT